MVELNEEANGFFNVPVEATAFLAAVLAFAIILLVIVMYVNKKLRLFNVNVEADSPKISPLPPNPVKPIPLSVKLRSQLGDAYSITPPESSSDSEEEVLRRLRQMTASSSHHQASSSHQSYQHPLSLSMSMRGYSLDQSPRRPLSQQQRYSQLQLLHQHKSLDFPVTSHSHQPTPSSYAHLQQHGHSPTHSNHSGGASSSRRPGPSLTSSMSASHFAGSHGMRPLRVTMIRDVDDSGSVPNSNSRRRAHQKGLTRSSTSAGRSGSNDGRDLISLAEKGKVCGGSSASSTSSNVSADMEELHNRQHRRLQSRHSSSLLHQHMPQHSLPHPASESHAAFHHLPLQRSVSRDREPPPRELNPSSRPHPLTVTSAASSHNQPQYRRMMMPPRTKSVDSESPPPSEPGLSNYGDSIADQDDHLFEVEDMSMGDGDLGMIVETSRASTSSVQCGSVEVAFDYEAAARKMTAHIIQARGIPSKDIGGANNTQVRLVLLPSRKQKHKTKVRPGENPQFMESFVFNKINPEDVSSLGIRFRLYGCERMRRERLLGEYVLGFASLHLELETTLWLNFEPKFHLSWDSRSETGSLARSDSASSTQSIQNGIPELLVGLAYNGTTGRLTVEVIKGSHFRNLAGGKAPDSYVKLVLVGCNGQEMGRAKSSLRRAQSNPLFKETFMFQVALFQISEVTLLVSIYGRKGVTRRELLGWFALGYNNSGDEETTHWEDMQEFAGEQMCRWHVLLQS